MTAMTLVAGLVVVVGQVRADAPASQWNIKQVVYMVAYANTTTTPPTPDTKDKFKVIVVANHPFIADSTVVTNKKYNLVLTALSSQRDTTVGKGKSKKTDFDATSQAYNAAKNRVVAIFEFKRGDLPPGFNPGDGGGTGTFTFTLQDTSTTSAFPDDSTPVIAFDAPDPVSPTVGP